MSVPPEYFARVAGSVNFPLLQGKRVAIVGVGQVGSKIAEELANCGVGYLRLIDHDVLERQNLFRHVLPKAYLDHNKAEALAEYLAGEVDDLQTESIPHSVDHEMSNYLLDPWLAETDLVVVATDEPRVQKQVGLRALMLGIPSIFPGLYEGGGGEVVVQLGYQEPCFGCFSAFRDATEPLQGMTATNFSALPVIFTSLMLSMALLDPKSEYGELIAGGPGRPLNQRFVLNSFGALTPKPLPRRGDCPACGGDPPPPTDPGSPTRQGAGPTTRSVGATEYPQREANPTSSPIARVFHAIGAATAALVVGIGAIVGVLAAAWLALAAAALCVLAPFAACLALFWVFIEILGHST
jgi:hypothetical protein